MRSWVRRAIATTSVAFAAACGGGSASEPAKEAPVVGVSTAPQSPVVDFAFDSLDARPVSSKTLGGKPTILAFIQTGDAWCQGQTEFLVEMAKRDGDKVNYLLVALDPPQNRELVEFYVQKLKVGFPVGLGDVQTSAAGFGLSKLPTTLVLDRAGRVTWRVDGRIAKSSEIREQMKGL